MRKNRWYVFAIAIVLTGMLMYGATLMRASKPQFYAPSRAALTSVRKDLSSIYTEEQNLLEDLRSAHEETLKIIHLLDAASFSREERLEVEQLKVKLLGLEESASLRNTTPEQLTKAYRGIQARLQTLLERSR
jgi:hypothetical protein